MKNALILHGAGNNSSDNWFPWLKLELEKLGYRVWIPDLPNSNTPILKDWLNAILLNKKWQFDKDSIIISHSAGSTFLLRLLDKLPDSVQIAKAILVAGKVKLGIKPEKDFYKKAFIEPPFNWKKIKRLVREFYFIHSDKDPYDCGKDQGEIMKKYLGGKLIVKKGQGHFSLKQGPEYKKFPEILKYID
jgi:hypothetical protein